MCRWIFVFFASSPNEKQLKCMFLRSHNFSPSILCVCGCTHSCHSMITCTSIWTISSTKRCRKKACCRWSSSMTNSIWRSECTSGFFATLKLFIASYRRRYCFWQLMALHHVPNGQPNVNDGKFFLDRVNLVFNEQNKRFTKITESICVWGACLKIGSEKIHCNPSLIRMPFRRVPNLWSTLKQR